VLENIHFMAEKAQKHKLIFRPHFKTHQSAEIGNWFRDAGVDKITVSSVGMASYFASHGWNDITIAFPLNVRELNTIENLAKKIKLNILISSQETIQYLVKNTKQKIGFFIKIDTGYHRAGVLSENLEQIQQILQTAESNKNLQFKGFLSHFGHTYKASNQKSVLDIFETGKRQLIELKEKFVKQYSDLIISMGDTPSCTLAKDFNGIDEIRPGNFVFYDLMQSNIGVCNERDIAVAVACPVVDIYPERGEVLIYGGAVHFSKEYIIDKHGNKIFGKVVQLTRNGWTEIEEKIFVNSLSQEHGIIKASVGFIKSLKIGDLLGILPVHSCLTANLMKKYRTINDELVEMWNSW
ncbi:MAG: alanine racemase, partial [Bacteroidota bacterium]